MTIPLLLSMKKSSESEKLQVEFKKIYLEFNDMVRSITYRMIGPAHLDDTVQDVFVKIWKNLSKFKSQSQLKTWIYKITLNTCYDFLKKKKLNIKSLMGNEEVSMSPSIGMAQAINKSLLELSPKHRSAIVLVCYEGLSLEEACSIEKINIGTMKSRLFNAKKQMKKILNSHGVHHA